MIKKRISLLTACILTLICLSFLSSCNFIKRSASMTILLVEDQELSEWNSVAIGDTYNSEFTRAGLLIYNTDFRTASFIPIVYSRQLLDSGTVDSVLEWFETNFSLKIDYSVLLSGDSGVNLYEVLDSLAEPVQINSQKINLSKDQDQIRWNTIIKNAELFLQDEVFRHIFSAAGSFIPEKTIRNFISMYTDDDAEFYYMRELVIDINSVNGYLYEREYIRQIYSAQRESVKE
ncbi:MAG: hypothetical protein HQ557_11260 [Bacteroidetes bacterium]|nr:hypothetical protein [Bacteroidota bacterium]